MFLLVFIVAVASVKCENTNPNIIFIMADDLGWNDVGFHGSNQIPTPNIDILAYSGIILNNYYVTPICTPSRSALMTGKYPIHTGLQHGVIHGSTPYGLSLSEKLMPQFLKDKNYVTRAVGKWHLGMQQGVIYGDQPWGLSVHEKLMPQYLKQLGYATKAVGKWHLGHFKSEYLPENRGFDTHYGYWVGHQDYYDHTSQENFMFWGYDMRRGLNITWSDYGNYTTDLFTEESVKIIRDHDQSKPLFLYVAHLATHSANPYRPLEAPAEIVSKFHYIPDKNRQLFAGMLSKLDDSVGSIVAALSAAGMLNNSIIVFSTDNGGPAAGFNLNAASNWPLRGVKNTLWEGGVRGAGLVWSPLLPASKVSSAMVHITDWLPTFLAAIVHNDTLNIDGVNQWNSLLEDIPSPRSEILLNIDENQKIAALRMNHWKLIKGSSYDGHWDGWYGPSGRDTVYDWKALYSCPAAKAIKKIRALPEKDKIMKLRIKANVSCSAVPTEFIFSGTENATYLFNVSEDPCEQKNLAAAEKRVLDILESKLKEYLKTVAPPRNKPCDPRSNPKYWGYAWVNWVDYL